MKKKDQKMERYQFRQLIEKELNDKGIKLTDKIFSASMQKFWNKYGSNYSIENVQIGVDFYIHFSNLYSNKKRKERESKKVYYTVSLCLVDKMDSRVEEIIRQFIDQTFEGNSCLILYNYSGEFKEIELSDGDSNLSNKFYKDSQTIFLINNNERTDSNKLYKADEPFENVMQDALTYVIGIVPHCISINLLNLNSFYGNKHLEFGLNGLEKAMENDKQILLMEYDDFNSGFYVPSWFIDNYKNFKQLDKVLISEQLTYTNNYRYEIKPVDLKLSPRKKNL